MRCEHIDIKERVKLFRMVYDVLMTVTLCLQKEWIYVMEFMAGGDMRSHCKRTLQFHEETVQFYAAELTLAVEFLHQRGIIHRQATCGFVAVVIEMIVNRSAYFLY